MRFTWDARMIVDGLDFRKEVRDDLGSEHNWNAFR